MSISDSDHSHDNAPRSARGAQFDLAVKDRSALTKGDLIIYPFLWSWQNEQGIIRAEKMRPCVVLMTLDQPTPTAVILPITTKQPSLRHDRMLIPPNECVRVGMDPTRMATIGLNDCNFDEIETSTTIRKRVPVRGFSPGFMDQVRKEFIRVFEQKRAVTVTRVPDPDHEYSL